jgi:DNA-binding NtrC family response regulator
MSYGAQSTVLLIEADASLRRLITIGLQYHGMLVIEASSFADLPAMPQSQPDLLVLDVDSGISSDWSLLAVTQAHPYFSSLPVVVLTWEEPAFPQKSTPTTASSQTSVTVVEERMTCLTKPFDARALHTTIEQMLVSTALRQAVHSQELACNPDVVTVPASPSPSIWPLITAAGLLIAFIGLMGILALTAGGVLIVVVSLLLWTLMPTTRQEQTLLPVP